MYEHFGYTAKVSELLFRIPGTGTGALDFACFRALGLEPPGSGLRSTFVDGLRRMQSSSVFSVVEHNKIIFSYKILYPKGGYNLTLYWVP